MTTTKFGYVESGDLAIFTDLYELTMMQGYFETGHNPLATFDLFFRDMPPDRGYVISAGLEQVIHYLESLSFDGKTLDFLNELGFSEGFLSYLDTFEFTGQMRALPEGTPVFPNEPLLEVTAPILEAQLFETLLINQVGFQSLVATKAARMRDVVERHGGDQSLVDFGSRRAHGTDAGVKAARAAYVGGFTGTSNVAAGHAFDIPVFGTMAHSWIQSFATERAAFEAFVDVYGEDAVLLVDTYDTINGVETALDVADSAGMDIAGVRLDSGDLIALSKRVNEMSEDLGIFISSGLDEYAIERFLTSGGVATGFGPGTALVTSDDAPTLDAVYKLVAVEREDEMRPTMKLSAGKVTYPGAKSVRRVKRGSQFERDVLALQDENPLDGKEQLVTVFEDGTLVYAPPDLDDIRERMFEQLKRLPEGTRRLRDPAVYPVSIGAGLQSMTDRLRNELTDQYT